MAIITQTVHLTTKTNAVPQIVRCVQNDSGREVKMILDDLTVTSGMTGEIAFLRSDGTHYTATATPNTSDSSFTAPIDQALTQDGKCFVQLKVMDVDVVSTFTFVIYVEKDTSGTVTEQEGISLTQAIQAAEDEADRAEAAADRAESAAELLELDVTLTSPTKADQAKAVGDAISGLTGNYNYLGTPTAYDDTHDFRIKMVQNGFRIKLNNTTPTAETTSVKQRYYRINNGIAFQTSSQQGSDSLWMPLVDGHKYRLILRKISGSITNSSGTARCLLYVKNSNTDNTGAGASATLSLFGDAEQYADFIAGSGNVNLIIYTSNGVLCTNLYIDVYLVDLDMYADNTGVDDILLHLSAVDDEISDIDGMLYDDPIRVTQTDMSTGYYWDLTNGSEPETVSNGNSIYTPSVIDLSEYIGEKLTIKVDAVVEGVRDLGFLDQNGIVQTHWTGTTAAARFSQTSDGYYTAEFDIEYPQFLFSYGTDATEIIISVPKVEKLKTASVIYISTDGNDSNDGKSPLKPMTTINSALKAGADTIYLLSGVYKQTIDLVNCKTGNLNIRAYSKDSKVYFYGRNSLIADSAEAVSGHSGVYSTPSTKTFNANRIWIFQDGVADESTEISDDERTSLHRGLRTRCGDTKIIACTSENVADAITEIEGASDYRFFYDSDNKILYFSCPETVSASHPICSGFDSKLFLNADRNIHLEMSGITCKYVPINLVGMSTPVISDCHVMGVCYDGGFMWDSACGVKLYRCESEHIFKGNLGDGFNAHSVTTGDADAQQTSAMLFDCWSHDNRDDGYSDHERCITSVYGGLFEYNDLGSGVTPAVGSHCTCYDVLSRHNKNGFEASGAPTSAEGGIGTSIDCYNCVSASNTNNGFKLTDEDITGHFVNCEAIGESVGYNAESDTIMHLIDCKAVDCTSVKSGLGNFVIKNGSAVTA